MDARRVFVSVSSKSAHWVKINESAQIAVDCAMSLIKKGEDQGLQLGEPRLLVEEKWGQRTHIIFDLRHDAYDPETAHLPTHGDIPVIAVWLSGEESLQVATQGLRDRVNHEVRDIHRKFGDGSRPPFFIDHSDGKVPFFISPRMISNEG